MSHDRGCFKCGRDVWEYDRCGDLDCVKKTVVEAMNYVGDKLAQQARRPKVYVVQQHLAKNDKGVLEPKFDLTPAAEFGELVYILKTDAKPQDLDPQDDLKTIRKAMQGIQECDYILPIGSTIFIALVAIVASEYCANVTFLYWNGRLKEYRDTTYYLGEDDDYDLLNGTE